jgi:hypothetical protein
MSRPFLFPLARGLLDESKPLEDSSLPALDLDALDSDRVPQSGTKASRGLMARYLWTGLLSAFLFDSLFGWYMRMQRLEFIEPAYSGFAWLIWLLSLVGLLIWCAYADEEYPGRARLTYGVFAVYALLSLYFASQPKVLN